jgi:hypothetical protein
MSDVLPVVLWYGGLLGVALVALLVLWALVLYAIKRTSDLLTAGIVAGALILAAFSSWAVSLSMGLSQGNQLLKVHQPLVRLVAGSVFARGALEDLRAVAEPSPDLTALQAKYDAHQASIESLLQAEWRYHDRLVTDYAEYLNSVNGVTQLVRLWDRAVLTGTLDTGLVSSERIQTHDDLLDSIRSRTLYRQYVQLDRRIADMRCRSEWFARIDGRPGKTSF